ncbi:hypothetical protein HanPSC8_Chr08g0334701 [Helianthus annuus]|nr:hypothetical protein HanPSC8_Chr08g0334701 [Helianthus annuus]
MKTFSSKHAYPKSQSAHQSNLFSSLSVHSMIRQHSHTQPNGNYHTIGGKILNNDNNQIVRYGGRDKR